LPIIAVLSLFIVSCSSPAGGGPETEPTSYTVTFKSGYGENETLYTKIVTPPAAAVADFPGNPSRNGYAFTGWNTQENGGGTAFTASTTVNADITVYARWTTAAPPGSYTVTFRMNDGTETVHAVKIVTSGTAVGTTDFPDPPVRNGYAFAEWNTQPTGTGTPFTASTTVNADIPVYARWTVTAPPGSYTVTFLLYDMIDETETVHAVKTVTPPATAVGAADFPSDPAWDGYAFLGWYTDQGTPFTASTTVNADITVYAVWTVTIIFLEDLPDFGDGAFDETGFTLSKTANGNPDSRTITITGEGYYTNPRWLVDGTLKGTGTSLTIAAADYRPGSHNLSLLVTISDVTWSRDIVFTVEN
jgi:uncharacterized repeat protein (TIGR02543 family)